VKQNFKLVEGTLFSISSLEDSDYVIIGFPYEATVSGLTGTAKAPKVVYETSQNIEEYSPYQERTIEDLKICVVNDPKIEFTGSNYKECLDVIYNTIKELKAMGKKIISLGGEHSITYALFKPYYEEFKNIALIHFDAHTDLRDEYHGTKYSHASVIKLIYNEFNLSEIYQLGIRSGTKDDFEFAKRKLNICPYDTSKMDKYLSQIGRKTPIYITIDVDVIDPSQFMGVGTPEPLGISYKTLLNELNKLKGHNIVGIDIVEYSPTQDPSLSSAHIMVHLIRELLLIWSSED